MVALYIHEYCQGFAFIFFFVCILFYIYFCRVYFVCFQSDYCVCMCVVDNISLFFLFMWRDASEGVQYIYFMYDE